MENSPFVYTNWNSGEPNNYGNGDELYIHVDPRNAKWNDLPNRIKIPFICEISASAQRQENNRSAGSTSGSGSRESGSGSGRGGSGSGSGYGRKRRSVDFPFFKTTADNRLNEAT